MIHLLATTYRKAVESPDLAIGPAGQAAHRKVWNRGEVHFEIRGDRPLEMLSFDSGDISLICRADLSGSVEANQSPARYVADLYLRQGDRFARDLQGAFAIVLFDHREQKLKAWTDHFGIERLIYSASPKGFGVSTDLRLLTGSGSTKAEVEPAAVLEYLQYSCIPAPRTIYKGIFRLEPGNAFTGGSTGVTTRYWDMSFQEEPAGSHSEEYWAEETLKSVRSAVERSVHGLQDPDKLGCFLSGGTDSSSIASLVGQITGKRPRTFSIGFDHPSYNEMGYARIAAQRCNAEHYEYFVKASDILALLKKAAETYDEPFGNSSVIPTHYCAKLAAEHGMTHMLAGDGGDEIFGGNARYVEDQVFQRYESIPGWLRRSLVEPAVSLASRVSSHRLPRRASSYVKRASIPMPDRIHSYSLLSSTPASELFTDGFMRTIQGNDPLEPARRHFRNAPTQNDLNRWLYLDLKMTITDNDLRKVTPMSRIAGITTRYPLLDPKLAEFTGRIPAGLKVKGAQLRYLFKKAMSGVLPQEIIKKTKHGFGLPYSVWVGEDKPLREFTFDALGSRRCRERGYFRPDLLEWLWSRYETIHRSYYGELLWIFLMLELWHLSQWNAQTAAEEVHTLSL